jgi:magnesium-transporting ATPase (P-type)
LKIFFIGLAADIAIVIISFLIFSALIPGSKRHVIWEKYISSFAKFVIYVFIATAAINALTAYIVYALRYEKYLNIIAPFIQSILIGFIAACVPRRGINEKRIK